MQVRNTNPIISFICKILCYAFFRDLSYLLFINGKHNKSDSNILGKKFNRMMLLFRMYIYLNNCDEFLMNIRRIAC